MTGRDPAGDELRGQLLRGAWLRRGVLGSSRRLLAAQAVPFRLACDGLACVSGRASSLAEDRGGEPLVAPLSGDPCLAYELTVGLYRERTFLAACVRFARGVSFRLHDGEEWGHVAIDEGADPSAPGHEGRSTGELSVRSRHQTEQVFRPHREHAADVEALLLQLGISSPRRYGRIELREARVVAGDAIKALGLGQREPHLEGARDGYRAPPLRYVIRAGDGQLLLGDP